MTEANLTFNELLDWIDAETEQWRGWFSRQPASIWTLSAGTGRLATVQDLLHHVVVIDLRYGQRLAGLPVSTYEQEAVADPAELFTIAKRGQDLLRTWAASASPADLATVIEFQTISAGTQRASKRKILGHTLMHHTRHMAQLATMLRQHGHPSDWSHDLLFSRALI